MGDTGSCSDVTLAILAGGEGSRLGVPKALLRVNDRPILEYLHERLAWPGPTLVVTAPGRERAPGAACFDAEAVDPVAGQGPLRGILTALEHAQTPLVVVTAVDMPLVTSSNLRELRAAFNQRPDALGLMTQGGAPRAPVDSNVLKNVRMSSSVAGTVRAPSSRVQPIPGVFRADAANLIQQRLAVNDRSIVRLTGDSRFVTIDVEWDSSVWQSINTPADAEQMRARGLRITGFQPVRESPARVEDP